MEETVHMYNHVSSCDRVDSEGGERNVDVGGRGGNQAVLCMWMV